MRFRSLLAVSSIALLAACGSTAGTDQTGVTVGASGTRFGEAPRSTGRNDFSVSQYGTDISGWSAEQKEFDSVVGSMVFFDTDQHTLTAAARSQLTNQAEWLKRFPNISITIEGHADERYTREYNLALGDRRANSVRSFLISQGVNGQRIRTISYGKERPLVLGSNPEAWAKNRRAVTVIE